VGVLALGGLFGQNMSGRRDAASNTPERPNILLITTDDLAVGDLDYMPIVRRLLGQQGVTFEDGIAPTPLCAPARASLLTGQYAQNTGVHSIEGPYGGYAAFDNDHTLATALQEAGYQTLFTGKYLNGYGKDTSTRESFPPGWDQWRATVDPSTYRFFDQLFNIDGHLVREHGYTTDVVTQQAQTMIRAATRGPRKTRRPWFAWVNYVAPHVGGPAGDDDPTKMYAGTENAFKTTVPAPRDRGYYQDVPLPRTPNTFPSETSDVPGNSPKQKRFTSKQQQILTRVYQRRLEADRGLDRAVGRQITFLRRTHQLADTLVVFTSDNGFVVGSQNLYGKLWHYDDILAIPALMRGPGIPRGRTTRTPITNPDIAATILAAAHATPPEPLDGVDMLPWLDEPSQLRVVPIVGWKVEDGSKRLYWGVRAGAWTYARLHGGGEELYDRAADPYEQHNLARQPRSQHTLELLRTLAKRFRDCAGDTCPKGFYPLTSSDQLPPADAT
jgi:arylsulfatase A-like enzyme